MAASPLQEIAAIGFLNVSSQTSAISRSIARETGRYGHRHQRGLLDGHLTRNDAGDAPVDRDRHLLGDGDRHLARRGLGDHPARGHGNSLDPLLGDVFAGGDGNGFDALLGHVLAGADFVGLDAFLGDRTEQVVTGMVSTRSSATISQVRTSYGSTRSSAT